jgi:hypothetical protein
MPKSLSKSFQDVAEMQVQLIDEAWNVFKDKGEASCLVIDTIATHSMI